MIHSENCSIDMIISFRVRMGRKRLRRQYTLKEGHHILSIMAQVLIHICGERAQLNQNCAYSQVQCRYSLLI
ncbi:hypothetical protein FGO68_gene17185 [Halteria grandinella]|uniref:Uncharacterized protein n=1 Tax=Halteria grandinella TaxID=5974 RepID=A0A8J8P8J0_HALGN|nr:hypothetical protein FGO68_gene17185 [Halteria grandinella]